MRIVIEGAGEVGSHLAKMLASEANEITVIDQDEARLAKLAMTVDVVTLAGPASSIHTLKEADVDHADLFIAVNPFTSQDVNIISALLAKKLGCPKVCARIDDEEYLSYENKYLFTEMGIDMMFYPEKIAAGEIVDLLKRTASTEAMDFARGRLQMAVFKLEEDSPLLDMKLSEFAEAVSTEELQFRVVAVSRASETLMPRPDMRFKYHDLVFIITKREGIAPIMAFLGKSNIEVGKLMILGGSQIGGMLAKSLSKQMETIKVIDKDRKRCLELSEKTDDNVIVVHGDGRNSDLLLEENIKEYDAFVAVTGNDEANILACVVARKFGVPRTIIALFFVYLCLLAEQYNISVTMMLGNVLERMTMYGVLVLAMMPGIQCGIVTGSGQLPLIQRLKKDFGAFVDEAHITTAYDVKHGKPAPDPYLMGLQKAGDLQPFEAIVVENAPLGVRSGHAARIFTIAVNTGPLPNEELLGAGADLIFPSMTELSRQCQRLLPTL